MTTATNNTKIVKNRAGIKITSLQMLSDSRPRHSTPPLQQPFGHMLTRSNCERPGRSPNISCSAAAIEGVDGRRGPRYRKSIFWRGDRDLAGLVQNNGLGCRNKSAKDVIQLFSSKIEP